MKKKSVKKMEILDILDVIDMTAEEVSRRNLKDLSNPLERYNEDEFRFRFRFTKNSFLELFGMFETSAEFQVRSHAVPPILQLLTTIRFFATGHFQRSDGDLIGIDRTTAGKIIHKVSKLIARNRSKFIVPLIELDVAKLQRDFYDIAGFPSVVGAIDCTHVPIVSPGGQNAEVYRNRKGVFSINVQAVCDANRKFTNIVARWAGSTHDSRIFQNSVLSDQLENGSIGGCLLGDNGYPCKEYLLTPLLNPVTPGEKRFNRCHIRTRCRIEQAFGVLKQRFRVLRTPLRTDLNHTLVIIVAVFCLHNYALQTKQPDFQDVEDDPSVSTVIIEQDDGATEEASTSTGKATRQQLIQNVFSY